MKTKKYEELIKNHEVKPNYLKNAGVSFFFGGLICIFGQLLIEMYIRWFGFVRDTASTLALVTVILITSILTGLGVYDEFGQIAKAGAFVPISGFANSLTSAALESKSEGVVLGIATNLFKLAGAVIVFAVVSAYVFGIIRYLLVEFNILPQLEQMMKLVCFYIH
ncbi:MAG: stage V sporulation protein AC [Turicibacter sp.]|nr:stage V sporulation protein AC [Turicibacter sp.]MDO5793797.1 stage V sporulation protein AC [Turicibacter sp.]